MPFFFEGESLGWPMEGVEVTTLGDRTSRGSVGVTGLGGVTVLAGSGLDARGVTAVTVVIRGRGSGLTMVHTDGDDTPPPFLISVSASMASELRMTRKWVLSDGVMVTVFSGSGFSFLVTWIISMKRK